MKNPLDRNGIDYIKSVLQRAFFVFMMCAILPLTACGTGNPADAGITAPADRAHGFFFSQMSEDIKAPLEIQHGEGDILGWEMPADTSGDAQLETAALLETNPPATMRLPLVYEKESITFFLEGDEYLTGATLEVYPLDENGSLLMDSSLSHAVPLTIEGSRAYFAAGLSPDWDLTSVADPDAIYRPQAYILHCKFNGSDKVYVFRVGVLIPHPENFKETDEIIPQESGDAWDLSPFVLVEAQSKERPYGGGLYLMTDAERQELQSLLKPETWSVLENPEARGMDGAPRIVTASETSLVMDGANQDCTVTISIYNRYSEARFIYTAPQEVLTAFQAFVHRMGDKVFPERFGDEV